MKYYIISKKLNSIDSYDDLKRAEALIDTLLKDHTAKDIIIIRGDRLDVASHLIPQPQKDET